MGQWAPRPTLGRVHCRPELPLLFPMSDLDRAYVSPEEFAALTGLSIATVRRRIKASQLPVIQPGGKRTRVLIRVDALAPQPETDAASRSNNSHPSIESGDAAIPAPSPSPPPRRRGRRPTLGRRDG